MVQCWTPAVVVPCTLSRLKGAAWRVRSGNYCSTTSELRPMLPTGGGGVGFFPFLFLFVTITNGGNGIHFPGDR